jgi:hypothetical protein
MKNSVIFLVLVLLVAAGVGVSSIRSGEEPKAEPAIIWGGPCEGGPVAFSVAAVLRGSPLPQGCSEMWAIVTPPSERGNLSAQVAWVLAHSAGVAGVFLDDFFGLNTTGQVSLLGSLSSFRGAVCPVLYAFTPQPDSTRGIPCVLLAMQPFSGYLYYELVHSASIDAGKPGPSPERVVATAPESWWSAAMRNATDALEARTVMLLEYTVPFSGWEHPIPPAYINAAESFSAENHMRLVVFE